MFCGIHCIRPHMSEAIAELHTVKFWIITAGLGILFSIVANLLTDALKASWKWPQSGRMRSDQHTRPTLPPETSTSMEPALMSLFLFVGGLLLFCFLFPPVGGWGHFRGRVLEGGAAAITDLMFDPRYPAAIAILGYAVEAFGTKKPAGVSTWKWVGLHMSVATALAVMVASTITLVVRLLNAA